MTRNSLVARFTAPAHAGYPLMRTSGAKRSTAFLSPRAILERDGDLSVIA
jgi:hypothetical protein